MQQHTHPTPPQAHQPGEHPSGERSEAARPAEHVGDHQFEHPVVAPVSKPSVAETSQW